MSRRPAKVEPATPSPWDRNEDGLWCPFCGYCIASAWHLEDDNDFRAPEECRDCGYPEDLEKMAEHFT